MGIELANAMSRCVTVTIAASVISLLATWKRVKFHGQHTVNESRDSEYALFDQITEMIVLA